MSDFLHDLAVANQNRNLEWDPEGKLTPLFFTAELAGEIGELCNVVKKLEREALGLRGSRASQGQLEEEFGDALVCLSLLANCFDINLEHVTREKFNASSKKLGLEVFL